MTIHLPRRGWEGRRFCLPEGLLGFCLADHPSRTKGGEIVTAFVRREPVQRVVRVLCFALPCSRGECPHLTVYSSGFDPEGKPRKHDSHTARWTQAFRPLT